MNIALIGYGKMGHEIERVSADRRNISIKQIFTGKNNLRAMGLRKSALKGVDVCIDFSTPSSVVSHIEAVAESGTDIVVGTTGWYGELGKVKKVVEERKIGLLYSPNFSIGMNIFFQIVAFAARQFAAYEMYDAAIHEIHHRGKVDSPSGTALALGEIILKHSRAKQELSKDPPKEQLKPSQLQISSTRVGKVAGTHRVLFDSASDSVELIHAAKDRSGFALGALVAAEWLHGKKGLDPMKEVLA
jgi:4-hydroxy-tetrahydrodipicolinate reductase